MAPSLPPVPPPRIGCPDCGDSGNVSLFRSFRPRVSPTVGLVLRGATLSEGFDSIQALKSLVLADGKDPTAFLGGLVLLQADFIQARYVESDGRTHLLLLMDSSTPLRPEHSTIAAVLLSPEGRALDCVRFACENLDTDLVPEIFVEPLADGTRVKVSRSGRGLKETFTYRVAHWQRPDREGVAKEGDPIFCALRISGDRFEVLAPE